MSHLNSCWFHLTYNDQFDLVGGQTKTVADISMVCLLSNQDAVPLTRRKYLMLQLLRNRGVVLGFYDSVGQNLSFTKNKMVRCQQSLITRIRETDIH